MDRAFICRYGGQGIYDLLGRDPRTEPLTALEQSVFSGCLLEHVVAERKPFIEMGIPPPD